MKHLKEIIKKNKIAIRAINLYYLLYKIISQYKKIRLNKFQLNGKRFDTSVIKRYKTSDTLFILGSGPSICELNSKHFKIISDHDSIGFGFWCIHDFAPTYYMMEFKFQPPEFKKVSEAIIKNLIFKGDIYKNIPIMFHFGDNYKNLSLEGINKLKDSLNNIYLPYYFGIKGTSKNELKNKLLFIEKFKYFNRFVIYKKNSTLFRAIIFAHRLGYKRIVLCGFDLKGDYFFEIDKNKYINKGLICPDRNLYRGDNHRTNDPKNKTGGMVISDIIPVLNEVILKTNSIEMFVTSKNSYFYPDFPIYGWKN